MSPLRKEPLIWYVGGEDVHMRIPLLRRLCQHGFNVAALGSESPEPFLREGITYYRYPLHRGLSIVSDLGTKNALRQLFKEGKPDLVHGFDTKPSIFTPLCALQSDIKGRVRTITGMGYVFSSDKTLAKCLRPIYQHLQQKASQAAGMTIFQNTDDYKYFLDHEMAFTDTSTVVKSSGIDTKDFLSKLPSPDDAKSLREQLALGKHRVVTMVTRVVREKGVIEFLQAANKICEELSDVTFLLIGPNEENRLRGIPQKELAPLTNQRIRYLGPKENIPALLSISTLFVLPTYYREGIPRVLLEAGAAGLPLIATDMPGCRDVVINKWNGLLVPARNPICLAKAITGLLNSPENELCKMGKNSREHIKNHFELSSVVDAYVGIYRQLLCL